MVERFGLPRPDPHARHEEDEGTSEFIADYVVLELGPARRAPFDETLAEALRVAVTACQAAHDASAFADKVRQLLIDAQTAGGRCCPSGSGPTTAPWLRLSLELDVNADHRRERRNAKRRDEQVPPAGRLIFRPAGLRVQIVVVRRRRV